MTDAPIARLEDLATEHVDGETVVFDRRANVAHCLTAVTARVWADADGTADVEEIAERLQMETFTVAQALIELEELDLLQPPVGEESVSRRAAMKKFAKKAAVVSTIPAAYSLAIGTPAQAASTTSCATVTCDVTTSFLNGSADAAKTGADNICKQSSKCRPASFCAGNATSAVNVFYRYKGVCSY